jgi:DNA-binding transcriptional MerR regulator
MEYSYDTNALVRILKISLRQIQWWDERQVIVPRQESHRRIYSAEEALLVSMVAELRRKGLSLHKVRAAVRKLDHRKLSAGNCLLVGADGRQVKILDSAAAWEHLKIADQAQFLVSIGDHIRRLELGFPAGRKSPGREKMKSARTNRAALPLRERTMVERNAAAHPGA